MSPVDWWPLFAHFLSLSLMAIGGAITTVPDMHRYLVEQQHWMTQSQFTASIALAQAAPGPNVTFVAVLGWNLGLNAGAASPAAGSWLWGVLGALTTLCGFLLPSATLTIFAARWCQRNRERLGVRAFKAGLAPVVIALLVATGWILASNQGVAIASWRLWLLSAAALLLVWRTRIHLLWMLAAGALLGWSGLL